MASSTEISSSVSAQSDLVAQALRRIPAQSAGGVIRFCAFASTTLGRTDKACASPLPAYTIPLYQPIWMIQESESLVEVLFDAFFLHLASVEPPQLL